MSNTQDQKAVEAHRASPHFRDWVVGGLYQMMLDRQVENLRLDPVIEGGIQGMQSSGALARLREQGQARVGSASEIAPRLI